MPSSLVPAFGGLFDFLVNNIVEFRPVPWLRLLDFGGILFRLQPCQRCLNVGELHIVSQIGEFEPFGPGVVGFLVAIAIVNVTEPSIRVRSEDVRS